MKTLVTFLLGMAAGALMMTGLEGDPRFWPRALMLAGFVGLALTRRWSSEVTLTRREAEDLLDGFHNTVAAKSAYAKLRAVAR